MESGMSVPVLSIVFMVVSVVISICLPVFLFFFFRKKYNAKVFPMILGVLGFVIFALVLEGLIHRIVIGRFISTSNQVLYVIYGIFMAGIFEETARFIAFKILKRKYKDAENHGIGTALSYGIGHGGSESILLAGLSLLIAVVGSVIINTGNIEVITGRYQGEALAAMNNQIAALLVTAPHMFLISGIERMMAIAVQLSLSVMVFYAVFGKNKLWLYPLAIIFHAIVDLSAMLFQIGVIKNVFLVEGIVFLSAVGMAFFAKYLHGKLSATEPFPKTEVLENPHDNS
jgi:uncharacterized membrane protein YhfC